MLFNSIDFLVFYPIVVTVYFVIPNKVKNIWLLAASYFFYMSWNAKYAILILTSTIITYASGLMIERVKRAENDEVRKEKYLKAIVACSFILNLGILFFFKYMNFTLNTLESLLGLLHISVKMPAFDIILPVGISFYTFQALSYTMDVYQGEIYAEKNFLQYALFVSFFPQLVAGPIERSKNLIRQLAVPKKFNFDNFREGILLMIWGYFMKIVLADRISIYVDTVYKDPATYGGWYLIVATVLFAVQIYCDFGGYSVIAMGTARVLGINLMENFDAPYISFSVSEFWRKWHISLTSWFKDYLYIPLGGSRKGKLRKYINIMIVFLVSGLWHGASFSFIIWGGLNGFYKVAAEVLMPVRERVRKALGINTRALWYRLLLAAGTFVLVDFAWIFFRAGGARDALSVIKHMITADNFHIFLDGSLYNCGIDPANFAVMILGIAILAVADCFKYKGIRIRDVIMRQKYPVRWAVYTVTILMVLVFGIWGPAFDKASFIYFQF